MKAGSGRVLRRLNSKFNSGVDKDVLEIFNESDV
jgi:hypothetical protein